MLHIRHSLCKTVRNVLFRFFLCFMLFTFFYFLSFPLSFVPSFVHSFRPFSLFLFYLTSSEVPSFLCVSFVSLSVPVNLQLNTRRCDGCQQSSEDMWQYTPVVLDTVHWLNYMWCTDVWGVECLCKEGTVALLKRPVRSVLSLVCVIGCLFCFVVLLIMTMYWHADTCITSRFFLQLRVFAALCLIDLPIQPGGLLQVR